MWQNSNNLLVIFSCYLYGQIVDDQSKMWGYSHWLMMFELINFKIFFKLNKLEIGHSIYSISLHHQSNKFNSIQFDWCLKYFTHYFKQVDICVKFICWIDHSTFECHINVNLFSYQVEMTEDGSELMVQGIGNYHQFKSNKYIINSQLLGFIGSQGNVKVVHA